MKDIKLRSITNDIMNYKVFEDEMGFRVETYYDDTDSSYHAYISHNQYGIKDYMFGASVLNGDGLTLEDDSVFLDMVAANLPDYIEDYYEDHMDIIGDIGRYVEDLHNFYVVCDLHDNGDFGDTRNTWSEAEVLAKQMIVNMKKNGLDYSGIAIIAYPSNDDATDMDNYSFIDHIGDREWSKEREEN